MLETAISSCGESLAKAVEEASGQSACRTDRTHHHQHGALQVNTSRVFEQEPQGRSSCRPTQPVLACNTRPQGSRAVGKAAPANPLSGCCGRYQAMEMF